jgi:hypothetical protein
MVTFPIANCWLYGADWAKGGVHMFFFVMLEAALAAALSVQIERSLGGAKRNNRLGGGGRSDTFE